MGFSRQECWSGLPFPSPGDLPDPGIEPGSPALETDTLPSEPPGKPSASVSPMPFLPFIVPISAWNVPLVSLTFLKRSLIFPVLLFSSIPLHWSLRKAFLSLFAILWNSAFRWIYLSYSPLPFTSLLFSAICKASSENHFAFLHFFFLRMNLITTSCTVSQTSVHSSSGTLSDLILSIYLSLSLYFKGFDLGHTWMVYWFSLLSSI